MSSVVPITVEDVETWVTELKRQLKDAETKHTEARNAEFRARQERDKAESDLKKWQTLYDGLTGKTGRE